MQLLLKEKNKYKKLQTRELESLVSTVVTVQQGDPSVTSGQGTATIPDFLGRMDAGRGSTQHPVSGPWGTCPHCSPPPTPWQVPEGDEHLAGGTGGSSVNTAVLQS